MGMFEYEFGVKNCDVARAMKVGVFSHTVVPTLLPQFISKVDVLQGDGGPGTVKVVTVNPAATGGEAKTFTERTTVHDGSTGTMAWEVEDARFSKPLAHTLTVKEVGADLQLRWTLEFEPADPATAPPEDVRTITVEVFKALKAHVEANPSWP